MQNMKDYVNGCIGSFRTIMDNRLSEIKEKIQSTVSKINRAKAELKKKIDRDEMLSITKSPVVKNWVNSLIKEKLHDGLRKIEGKVKTYHQEWLEKGWTEDVVGRVKIYVSDKIASIFKEMMESGELDAFMQRTFGEKAATAALQFLLPKLADLQQRYEAVFGRWESLSQLLPQVSFPYAHVVICKTKYSSRNRREKGTNPDKEVKRARVRSDKERARASKRVFWNPVSNSSMFHFITF